MKNLVKDLLFTSLLILLSSLSLYGVLTHNTPVFSVGPMQVAAFYNGISLFQSNKNIYYTVSPFNDFIIDQDRARSAFISKEEIKYNWFSSTVGSSHIKDIQDELSTYLFGTAPTVTFKKGHKIWYTLSKKNNTLKVKRVIEASGKSEIEEQGITLSYDVSDFIYDKFGNIYNFKNPEDLVLFKKVYDRSLVVPRYDLTAQVPENIIIITNPHLNATIVIKASQDQLLFVNQNARLIEIREQIQPQNAKYSQEIEMHVFNSPKEALESL